MASEILAVPEEHLSDFCFLLEVGMDAGEWDAEMTEALHRWITDERDYMARWENDDA